MRRSEQIHYFFINLIRAGFLKQSSIFTRKERLSIACLAVACALVGKFVWVFFFAKSLVVTMPWWIGDLLGITIASPLFIALHHIPHLRFLSISGDRSDFNRQVLQSFQEGVLVYDKEGRIIFLNRFMEDLCGKSADACLGRQAVEVFPFLNDTAIPGTFQQALAGETVYHAPFVWQSLNNGTAHSVTVVQAPLLDDMGRIDGVIERVSNISQRIEADQSLTASETRFQSIVDNSPTAIYSKDMDGNYLFINRCFESLFAVNNVAIKGKTDFDVFSSEQADALRENDRQVVLSGQPQLFEEKVRHPDGSLHTYLSHKFPLSDAHGNINAVCGISADITERKQYEQLLLESELRWKFALESGGDGVWDWDLSTGKVFLSPRCIEILGFSELDKEDYYRNWEATIHPEDLERMNTALNAHLNQQSKRFSNEHRARHVDGEYRWILTRGLVVSRDPAGKALRMIGTQTDITGRKQFQWAQLSKIVDGSPEAMLLVTENGMIRLANDPASRIFAYAQGDLIGRNVDELVPLDSRDGHDHKRAQFMSENKARPMSGNRALNALRKDGSEFPVEISLTPIELENQRSLIVSILDISERKHIEHEMQLMAMVYKAIGEAVIVADAKNKIIAVNEAFTRLTGYGEQEVLGKSTDLLKSGRHDSDFYQAMWHSLTLTGHWQGEIWNRRKNGEIYHEWLVINSIYGSNGAVERRVAMFSEITEQKKAEQTIWRQANYDPLTDLANRRMFQDRLDQEIKKAQRAGGCLGVILLDLDHFKEVNDTLGHGMGDILLQEAANRLLGCVRQTDTVARLGGDEFTIILSALDSEFSADRVAQAILQKLSEPFTLDDERVYISASIGITFYPQDATESEQLIKNADQAMYSAKQLGRNRYNYFTAEMEQFAQNRMRLTHDLRHALANDEFLLFYQPIVEMSSGKIYKAEALIRWQHPERGMVSPADFIPLAEETGLINDIGDWVFRVAAKQAGEWRNHYFPHFKIGVNKSPVQFGKRNQSAVDWFVYLNELGLSGESIVIEITEGLLLDASNSTREHLFAYRDAGIQVALDDFGTGYSALSYLKKFDIDYLKIDQTFTRNMATDEGDRALCEAIIVLAHKLGLKVIAEGIETEQQFQLLLEAGCDYGQGYLISKPAPAEEIELILARQAGS
jgi:diguanylate cyclase (GGDEF)-like protein/PAS domain S-box-containing protein